MNDEMMKQIINEEIRNAIRDNQDKIVQEQLGVDALNLLRRTRKKIKGYGQKRQQKREETASKKAREKDIVSLIKLGYKLETQFDIDLDIDAPTVALAIDNKAERYKQDPKKMRHELRRASFAALKKEFKSALNDYIRHFWQEEEGARDRAIAKRQDVEKMIPFVNQAWEREFNPGYWSGNLFAATVTSKLQKGEDIRSLKPSEILKSVDKFKLRK